MRNPEGTPIWYELLTASAELGPVCAKTAVPWSTDGTADGGGAVPSNHWSSATQSARSSGFGSTPLPNCAQAPCRLD